MIVSIAALALAIPFVYIVFILTYTYYQFAASGGDYQAKIHNLIVSNIVIGNGKLLDIGSGSASLIVKAAKAFPKMRLTGIDFWGEDWEYSKALCEKNAQAEGVAERIEFIKASASKLPFPDNEFNILVSCLTFHEVKDESDKRKVLQEAFRVLKKDGEFVFMDLFLEEKDFGKHDDFVKFLKSLGLSRVEITKLDEMIKLPKILLQKKILGNALIIKGVK